MISKWKTISSKHVHENPWFKIRKDEVIRPDGKPGTYHVIERRNSVFIVPTTKDGDIILEKQFRYPAQQESWEIPGGGIDGNETPLEAAKRELQEETGFVATTWQALGQAEMTNGTSPAVSHIFTASGLEDTGKHLQEEEGITQTKAFTRSELKQMIKNGEIKDGPSLCAFMMMSVRGEF